MVGTRIQGLHRRIPETRGNRWHCGSCSRFPPALKQAILEKLLPAANALIQGKATDEQIARIPCLMRSLQALSITGWRDLLEPLIVIDQILRRDPCLVRMDYASREGYRRAVAEIAERSELSEADISAVAVGLWPQRQKPNLLPRTELAPAKCMSAIT